MPSSSPEALSAPTAPLVWTQTFQVRAYEVGPGNEASPLTVLDYFQEAAGEHAEALGIGAPDIGGREGAWVLARLAMQISRLPLWRDTVTVETWPSGRDGLRATRDLLLRSAKGEVLVRARTVWFVFDPARRRPVRLPPAVLAIAPPERERALNLGPAPLAPEAHETTRTFDVRRADLDRNHHVNNARFAEWALEAGPEDARLAALDLAFKGEAVLGDTVESVSAPSGEGTRAHAILRHGDRATIATARTHWT